MVEGRPSSRFRNPAAQIQGSNGKATGTIRPITAKNSMTWRTPRRSIRAPPWIESRNGSSDRAPMTMPKANGEGSR